MAGAFALCFGPSDAAVAQRTSTRDVVVDFAGLDGALVRVRLEGVSQRDELLDAVLASPLVGEGFDAGAVLDRFPQLTRTSDAEFVLFAVLPSASGAGTPMVACRVALDAAGRRGAKALLTDERFSIAQREVAGIEVHELSFSDRRRPGGTFELALVGNDLVFANWAGAFERVLTVADGATPPRRGSTARGDAHLRVRIDLSNLDSRLEGALLPASLRSLLGSVVACSGRPTARTFDSDVRLLSGGHLGGSATIAFGDLRPSVSSSTSGCGDCGEPKPQSWNSLSRRLGEGRGPCAVVLGDGDLQVSGVGLSHAHGPREERADHAGRGDHGTAAAPGPVALVRPDRDALRRGLQLVGRLGPSDAEAVGAFYLLDPSDTDGARAESGTVSAPLLACGRVRVHEQGLALDWVAAPASKEQRR